MIVIKYIINIVRTHQIIRIVDVQLYLNALNYTRLLLIVNFY